MSLALRARLVLAALFGVLLVVTLGVALQLREIAALTEDVLGPDARLLGAAAEMQRLLGEADRGPAFEQAFSEQLAQLEQARPGDDEQAVAVRVAEAFAAYVEHQRELAARGEGQHADETSVRNAVAALSTVAGDQARRITEAVRFEALTIAVGLGMLAALVVVFAVWVFQAVRVRVFDRLAVIDATAAAIVAGDVTRRVGDTGNDELARVAAALDRVLDLRDRGEAAVRGRNRELRALLVALLHEWPHPVAVVGIDGEILVSTLSGEEEDALRSITPELRTAARTLLSRGFLAVNELETEIRVGALRSVRIWALSIGDQRIVGWMAAIEEQERDPARAR
jgi:hypothetical protein